MLWTAVFTYPLMVGIQTVSARIGRVTGRGLAANMRHLFPRWLTYAVVSLLVIANTINIAADIAAMGEALQLLVGRGEHGHALVFGLISLVLQVFIPYQRYVRVLKWLTLSLLAYVAVAFTVHVPWNEVMARTLLPNVTLTGLRGSIGGGSRQNGFTSSLLLRRWAARHSISPRSTRSRHWSGAR